MYAYALRRIVRLFSGSTKPPACVPKDFQPESRIEDACMVGRAKHTSDLKHAGFEQGKSLFKKSDVVDEQNEKVGSSLRKNINDSGGYDDDLVNLMKRLEWKEEKRVKKEKRQQAEEDKQNQQKDPQLGDEKSHSSDMREVYKQNQQKDPQLGDGKKP